MNKPKRRFARFYYDEFIEEFPDVYADGPAFATWMRLLVVSEKAWPAAPELPRSVTKRDLDVLVSSGLVALGRHYTFSVRGHNAERTRRNEAANVGANASANARAIAQQTLMQTPSLEKTETENKKSSPLPLTRGRRENGTNPRATGDNPRAKGTSPRQELARRKRDPTPIHEILSRVNTGGRP